MREEIKDFFTSEKIVMHVKAIVLTGEGKAFSAGGDLSALKEVMQFQEERDYNLDMR